MSIWGYKNPLGDGRLTRALMDKAWSAEVYAITKEQFFGPERGSSSVIYAYTADAAVSLVCTTTYNTTWSTNTGDVTVRATANYGHSRWGWKCPTDDPHITRMYMDRAWGMEVYTANILQYFGGAEIAFLTQDAVTSITGNVTQLVTGTMAVVLDDSVVSMTGQVTSATTVTGTLAFTTDDALVRVGDPGRVILVPAKPRNLPVDGKSRWYQLDRYPREIEVDGRWRFATIKTAPRVASIVEADREVAA